MRQAAYRGSKVDIIREIKVVGGIVEWVSVCCLYRAACSELAAGSSRYNYLYLIEARNKTECSSLDFFPKLRRTATLCRAFNWAANSNYMLTLMRRTS